MSGLRMAGLAPAIILPLALPCCRQGSGSASAPTYPTCGDRRPNIIVLTVDTLRADHVALYGHARNTMPAIEAFAKTAVVFDNAVVPRGSTRPSYASMLTGLYPFRHGVRTGRTELHGDLVTLTETLKSAGYHTAAFVSNFVMVEELSGFSQGFDVYDDHIEKCESNPFVHERTAGNTLEAILKWLASDPPQPFFLFTNFIDPHGPYHPPEKFRKGYRSDRTHLLKREQIPGYLYVEGQLNYFDYVDRYDGEIRYTDEVLGVLIDKLKRKGLWDDALVVFTADHGESFGEHKSFFDHHFGVWESTAHVPLAVRLPVWSMTQAAVSPKRVRSVCSPMDLAPTILAYLELSSHVKFDGRNLLPLMLGSEDDDRTVLVEFPSLTNKTRNDRTPDVYAARTATHKLLRLLDQHTKAIRQQVVYSLTADRMEQRPMRFDPNQAVHRKLAGDLDALLAEVHTYVLPFTLTVQVVTSERRHAIVEKRQHAAKTVEKALSDDQVERLRGLGYVQ